MPGCCSNLEGPATSVRHSKNFDQERGVREMDKSTQTDDVELKLDELGDLIADDEDLLARIRWNRRTETLALLWHNRRSVLWMLLMGGVVAASYAYFVLPKTYQSTVLLMPQNSQTTDLASTAMSQIAPGDLASLLGIEDPSAIYLSVLHSRNIQDRIIQSLDLMHIYRQRSMELTRAALLANTKFDADKKSGVITIIVTATNPQLAAKIAQSYADDLNSVMASLSSSAARRERVFLEGRLKTAKDDLDSASLEFSRYASNNATLDPKDQGASMVKAAAEMQGNLVAAQATLGSLQQAYTDNNIRVKAARAKVDELRKQLKTLTGTDTPQPLDKDFYPSIRQLPLLGARWADLYRRTEMDETIYELLTKQYEIAQFEEARDMPTVSVLDSADVPERKSGPPRMLITLMGSLFFGFLAGARVILVDAWKRSGVDDPRKTLVIRTCTALGLRRLLPS